MWGKASATRWTCHIGLINVILHILIVWCDFNIITSALCRTSWMNNHSAIAAHGGHKRQVDMTLQVCESKQSRQTRLDGHWFSVFLDTASTMCEAHIFVPWVIPERSCFFFCLQGNFNGRKQPYVITICNSLQRWILLWHYTNYIN